MKRSILLLALLALAAAAPALADWPAGGIKVNGFNNNDQWNCSMVPDGSEGMIYVWQEGGTSIWAQRYDHMGNRVWPMDVRVDPDSGNLDAVTACRDGAGGVVVAWVEFGAVQRVRLQRIDGAGALQWPDRGVPVTLTPGLGQREPVLMPGTASSEPMVLFGQNTAGDIWRTTIQKLNLSGVRQWGTDGILVCNNDTSQQSLFGLAVSDTSAIVGWNDLRAGNYDVYATMVYPSGPVFPSGWAMCDAAGSQMNPCIASDDSGGAVIAWQDGRNGNWDIFAQRYTVNNLQDWQWNGMPVSVFTGQQENLDICRAQNKGVVICWQDSRLSDEAVYAQRLNNRGYRQWTVGLDSNGIIVSDTVGAQVLPRIVPNGLNDGFAVTWRDWRYGNNDIFARVVGFSGSLGPEQRICTSPANQQDPRVMRSGSQWIYFSWRDFRNGIESDLYAQRMNWSGYLGSVLAPELAAPPDMAVLGTVNDTLRWVKSPPLGTVLDYRVQIDNDGSFSAPVYNQVRNDSFAVPPLATGNTYYWRVRTLYPAMTDSSNWSNVWSFSVDTSVPAVPALYGPPDNWFAGNTWIDFSWQDVSATYYHIQVSDEPNFLPSGLQVDDSLGAMFSYGHDFSGTTAEGDYWWRVRAGSGAHNWSAWSASRRFVIDISPATVDSSRPAHNNNNVPVNSVIRVYFSEPVRTDTSLHFTCSPDPGNWNVSQIGNVIEFNPANFNFSQSYNFDVTVRDSAWNQTGPYGFSFTTANVVDTVPPRLTVLANSQPMDLGSSFVFEAYAKDEHTLNQVRLVYGPAGSGTSYDTTMVLVPGSDSLWRHTIPSNRIPARGVQYKVWAQDSILSGGLNNVTNFPADPTDWWVHAVRFIGGAYSASPGNDVWQMLSVPGNYGSVSMHDMLADDLGGYDATKWRLFKYDNTSLLEQNAPGSGIVGSGDALWLRHRLGAAVNLDFGSVELSYGNRLRSLPATIALAPGVWSDVGNPLAFPVGWDTIIALSDTAGVAGPYHYNGNAWVYPNQVVYGGSFEPYGGYSFRNNTGSSATLRIPVIAAYKEGGKRPPLWPEGWQARLTVRSGQQYDDAFLGVGAGTAAGPDRWDFPEPPAGLAEASGHFVIDGEAYATDLRPGLGAGQVWDYAVVCGTGEVRIECGLPALPGVRLHLADLARQASFELADGYAYAFTPEPGERERRFKLVAGDESYVRQTLGSIFSVPAVTLLERNRPNPFSGSTELAYQLAAAGRVTIALYNVAGQKVRTLVDREQLPGRYGLRWDGRDDRGRSVAAGVYVCRLAAPGTSQVRKLTVVR